MKDFEKEISEFLNDAHGEVKIKGRVPSESEIKELLGL